MDRLAKTIDIDILKNIGPVTPQTIPMILWKYPQIIPEPLRNIILKDIQDFTLILGGGIAVGIGLNLIAPKVYPPFISLPVATRCILRVTLLSVPIVGVFPLLQDRFRLYLKLAKITTASIEQMQRIQKITSLVS